MNKMSPDERKEKNMLEEARYFTRDYWFMDGKGKEAMIEEFRHSPSVLDSMEEGDSLEGSIDDHMTNGFNSVAWNYKIDPKDLYKKVLNHLFPCK